MKIATCNEPWREVPIEEVFARAARIGFDGVEIAPFTLAEDVRTIPPARRREIREAAAHAGVQVVGLHWLLVSPKGLHLTTADAAVRQETAGCLKALADFCGDLGGSVMVFGSPKQRSLTPGTTFVEACKRARDVFAECAPTCAARGVSLCIEALAPAETDFINTLEQACKLADDVGHPAIGAMLDMKAMSSMPGGIVENVQRFGRRAWHFHANQPSGRGVGMLAPATQPAVDLPAVLGALAGSGYKGWISCEPFDYEPDPDTVARTALQALRAALPS